MDTYLHLLNCMCGYTNMCISVWGPQNTWMLKKRPVTSSMGQRKANQGHWSFGCVLWGYAKARYHQALTLLLHQTPVGLCSILSPLRDPGSSLCSGCCRSSWGRRTAASSAGDQRPWLRTGSHFSGCTIVPLLQGKEGSQSSLCPYM